MPPSLNYIHVQSSKASEETQFATKKNSFANSKCCLIYDLPETPNQHVIMPKNIDANQVHEIFFFEDHKVQ